MQTKTIPARDLAAGHRRVIHAGTGSAATVEGTELLDDVVIVHYEDMSPDEFPLDHPVQIVDDFAEMALIAAGTAAATGYLPETMVEFFGPPISVYTRAQAITDGALIPVDAAVAREAGFTYPVALTAAAHADTVTWTRSGALQDEAGRLWDVLWVAAHTIRAAKRAGFDGDRLPFRLMRVPNTGRGRTPVYTDLVLHVGGGDHAEPVITIMRPGES